ncbi:MAG: hypothetical protein K6G76_00895 [Lachnospiraceae bacterium]|nr:hypothetical protein [Lachnospiraceae bacterium]
MLVKELFVVIGICVCMLLAGCGEINVKNHFDENTKSENKADGEELIAYKENAGDEKTKIVFTSDEIYANVQNDLEWGLFNNYADYYFNYMNAEQTDYYYKQASAEDIYEALQSIYKMQFHYDKLDVVDDDKNVTIRIPVTIMNSEYVYSYEGTKTSDDTLHFTGCKLYNKDEKDVFEEAKVVHTLSIKVRIDTDKEIEKNSSLKSPDSKMISYIEQHNFLEQGKYMSGAKLTSGTYYLNGDANSKQYYVVYDNQIEFSAENGNKWYYKTLSKDDGDYVYYGYGLNGNGFSEGIGLKYTNDKLISEVDGSTYILCDK